MWEVAGIITITLMVAYWRIVPRCAVDFATAKTAEALSVEQRTTATITTQLLMIGIFWPK